MIIGISGKKGSGKDAVAKIIQYLTSPSALAHNHGFEECHEQGFVYDVIWKNKKFADKLKDIVCILIGCTRKQLEDHEFKNTSLGKTWSVYKGVNTGILRTIDWMHNNVWNNGYTPSEKGWKLVEMTPRLLMQLVGTECGREILHPNIWVNALMSEYGDRIFSEDEGDWIYPNWLITDVRFPNEAKAIKEREGLLIRVERNTENNDNHPSETALDDYKEFDYVIDNNSSISDLVEKVTKILHKEKII